MFVSVFSSGRNFVQLSRTILVVFFFQLPSGNPFILQIKQRVGEDHPPEYLTIYTLAILIEGHWRNTSVQIF